MTRVSVFGLGYVGCVSAAALADTGHQVIGVDVNDEKVASVNAGKSPVVEPGLDEAIGQAVAAGRLRATTDPADAVANSDVSLICVGTPSRRNGSLDLAYLQRVSKQIGAAIGGKPGYHVVVVRSTVLPGTTHGVVIPAIERESGKKYGEGFGVSVNPEFLREGTALKDFREPPLTLVGHNHAADASGTIGLYQSIDAPLVSTSIRVAEMMKYASNTWHALKVCFANEIGNICKAVGVDSHEVMDIFCRDEKLNLSSYYLRPGFAFGGSCLPKDVRALQYRAKEVDVDVPVISSILPSNRLQIEHAFDQVMETGKRRIALLGFSFKAGTDDLRESPMVILAEALLGKGLTLQIYDKNVSLARLVGANKGYIDTQIPHLSSLLCPSLDEVVANAEVVVVGNRSPAFAEAIEKTRSDQIVIDLVRLPVVSARVQADYRGLCWWSPALMYHDVVPEGAEDSSGFPGRDAALYKVTPELFEAHLAAIVRACGPSAAPAITFDDGGGSALAAADALERHGLRGCFFVTTDYLNAAGFLDEAGVRELRRRGHVVGSHSCSHPLRMGHCPWTQLRDEWTRSGEVLARILGEPVTVASVPGGDFAPAVAVAAAQAGFRELFTSEPTTGRRAGPGFALHGRYVIRRWTSPETAAGLAAGRWLPCAGQALSWNVRKVAKRLGGERYLSLRQRLLASRSEVRWGDRPEPPAAPTAHRR